MLKFFRKKKEEPITAPEFDYSSLDEGYLNCKNCCGKVYFEELTPLSVAECPHCSKNIFIPLLMDKYYLVSPIGSGGMGQVYKAYDSSTGKIYAVKILQRIEEAEMALEICNHTNICDVFEYGRLGDESYMVIEFLEGERLDLYVKERGPVDEEKVLLWGLQLLSALHHIYDCGYLYRDLKPQNIIVRNNGKDIVLFDFGLCLELDKADDVRGDDVEGSPQYFPPERCNFEKEDMYSEIYSLGMVLFFCLSGEPYFDADTAMELLEQHIRRLRIKSVFERLENCNPDIACIIDKMIKREPAMRFQTYDEVYIELDNIYKMYQSC